MKIKRKVVTIVTVCLLAASVYTAIAPKESGECFLVAETPTSAIPTSALEIPQGIDYTPACEILPARAPQYINITMSDEERKELAAIVYLEAGNQSADGQQAIVEVVFNRVLHDSFPDTVHDVLHQGEDSQVPQFTTIYQIDKAEPSQAQYDAIDAALYGDTILDRDVVFFSRGGENNRIWGRIGDHVFCREYVWG